MKKILLSSGIIIFALTSMALGGTGAFFSDAETSTGNTFTAGAIDLKIDNTSYYNGVAYATTTWALKDLTIEKFFNFLDLKPSDYGEDTISLHVDTNDAYLCADVTLTSNDDNGLTDPEGEVDQTAGPIGEGELANQVNFIWWADDGDNVLEDNENVISQGPIGALALDVPFKFPLADSQTNIWTGSGGPVVGNQTYYIGKAWCFGTLTEAPLAQDNATGPVFPRTPANSTGGISCDGSLLGNETQTDSLTANVSFTAVQSRHNPDFRCVAPTSLTLKKEVVNDNLGGASASAWTLSADGPGVNDFSGLGPTVTSGALPAGTYNLSESGGPTGYTASTWSCVKNNQAPVLGNNITLAQGDVATCTIVNNDNVPLACTEGQVWADSVVLGDQGRRKDGTLVLVDRRNPATTLGAPQTTGTPSDPIVTPNSFYSLGFNVGTTSTRSIIVAFNDNLILNGSGADLRVYEVTGGVYPDEHIKVEVSKDGSNWFLAAADVVRDADVDIAPSGLNWAKYVRLTDINLTAPFPNDADGYDVDALHALNCVQPTS